MLFAFRAISLQAVLVSKIFLFQRIGLRPSDLRLFGPSPCQIPWPLPTSRNSLLLLSLSNNAHLAALARPPRVLTHYFSPSTRLIHRKRFRIAFGLWLALEPYPHLRPDGIPVRQAGVLPTSFSGFRLAMDTFGVPLCPSRYRAGSGLSPVRLRPCRAVG